MSAVKFYLIAYGGFAVGWILAAQLFHFTAVPGSIAAPAGGLCGLVLGGMVTLGLSLRRRRRDK